MASAGADVQHDFAAGVADWEELFNHGFYETAQAALEPFGGGESGDPRVAFLAACTQLPRLRYPEARESLEHARSILVENPGLAAKAAGGIFARLPEATQMLLEALEGGLMPQLRVPPVEFLRKPTRSSLATAGTAGGGLGRYVPPLAVYRAASLVEAQKSMEGPPRLPPAPSLIEPITIRDGSIVIVTDSVRQQPRQDAKPETPSAERVRVSAINRDMADALKDKNQTLERIQAFWRSGEKGAAMALAQQAVSRFPQSSSVREAFARVQEAVERKESAARTYLAAARLASTSESSPGRMERCLQKTVELAGDNLTLLREVLSTAQGHGLTDLAKQSLIRLLSLHPTTSDPIQRQTWARHLERLDPGNPLVQSTLESTLAAGGQAGALAVSGGAIGGAMAEPSIGEDMRSFEPMAPLPVAQRSPSPKEPGAAGPAIAEPGEEVQPPPPPPSGPIASSFEPSWTRTAVPPRPPMEARPGGWSKRPPKGQPPTAPPPAGPPTVKPPRGKSGAAETVRTRPPVALESAPTTTYPCFYCGKPIPSTQVLCPHCSHQQPAFLQKRVEQMQAAPESPGNPPTRRSINPESPLTRNTVDSQREQTVQFLLIGAGLLTLLGWISGSSVISMLGFALASSVEKRGADTPEGAKVGAKALKAAAFVGFVLGIFRGSPF